MKLGKQMLFVPLVGKTSRERQKEGLKLIKNLPLLPRLTAVLPPQGREISKGFTLIELLVVVLIIGILVAVALPQYQLAVMKSRYSTLKYLTQSIAHAQEVFYLANGQYADDFEKLDIQMPSNFTNKNAYSYTYAWGNCTTYDVSNNKRYHYMVRCKNDLSQLGYQVFLKHTKIPDERRCIAYVSEKESLQNKVCQQETQQTFGVDAATYWIWTYN